jgi:hypothetical protein
VTGAAEGLFIARLHQPVARDMLGIGAQPVPGPSAPFRHDGSVDRGFNCRKQELVGQKSKVGTTSFTADVLEVDPLLTPLAGECLYGDLGSNS